MTTEVQVQGLVRTRRSTEALKRIGDEMPTNEDQVEAGRLLVRVEEAAGLLGIARTSMYKLIATGEVESVRVGRLRRVPVACLEEFVGRLRTGVTDSTDGG